MVNLEEVKKVISDKLKEIKYDLSSIEYVEDGGEKYLRIVVDRKETINMDDIVDVTHCLSDLLDSVNLIDEAYVLDISSKGIETDIDVNKIEDYQNETINISYLRDDEEKNIDCKIINIDGENITFQYFVKGAKKKVILTKKEILNARKVIKI